jgi:CHAT domain-containing protein
MITDPQPGYTRPIPTYGAFVAVAGRDGPVWVNLGTAEEIDGLVTAWRTELIAAGASRASPAIAEGACRRAGAALRARIWDAVSAHLAGTRRVLVVPDGSLCRVAFAALPVGTERYLIQAGPESHLLAAEKDIVPGDRDAPQGSGLLTLGGVDYEQDASTDLLLARLDEPAGGELFRGARSACAYLDSIRFEPLPSTEREIDDIIEIWSRHEHRSVAAPGTTRGSGPGTADVLRLTGSHASEGSFKRLAAGKEILHLATHGIFLDGHCASATHGGRGIGGIVAVEGYEAAPAAGENPLRLSGLALAGANVRAAAAPEADDGILTAEEIATLDLAGLEWVVLSACDTGLGEIRTGEGILGLWRAFHVAGARTLIMSLWPVEDEATREWMRALYEGRFAEGLDTAAAMHHANLTTLEARRERGESTHPFFWAAFVASGGWQ